MNLITLKLVNLDTGTALAFIAEGSPIRDELRQYVQNTKMVITQTAFNEFTNIVQGSGGSLEQDRASRFIERVTLIADNPSTRALNLKPTRKLGANDIIILGTGDQLGILTMTADAKAVSAASAQKVEFNVYVHAPPRLSGK